MTNQNRNLNNIVPLILFITGLVAFLVLKTYGFNPCRSDENIYFYMSKLFAQGIVPYRDFFFAHPPFKLIFMGTLFKLLGFHFTLAKVVPVLVAMATASFLFAAVRDQFGSGIGLLAALLFLFTYDQLRGSSHYTGINLTVMFMVIGLFFALRQKLFWGGIFFGLGSITGFYAIVGAGALAIFWLLNNRRQFVRFIIGFVLIFLGTNLICALLFGRNYIEPVYVYHFLKPRVHGWNAIIFYRVFRNNLLVLIPALLSPLTLLWKNKIGSCDETRMSSRRLAILLMIMVFCYILFFIVLKRIFDFYFILLFPFCAILAAYALWMFFARLMRRSRPSLNQFIVRFISGILIAVPLLWNGIWASRKLIRHESHYLKVASQIAEYIAQHSSSKDKLFGDSSSTPLMAVLANRRIAANFIDTNAMRFRSGITSVDQCLRELRSDQPKYILVKPNVGFIRVAGFQAYIDKYYALEKTFKDPYYGSFLLYQIKQQP
jgi:hypothetical protein